MESYKHKFAKSVLAGWLRGPSEMLPPFSWRSNRGAPNYGVWEEYPFCIDENNRLIGNDPVWDELDWHSLNYLSTEAAGRFRDAPPTYDELIAAKLLPIVIFDIALQHKGQVYYGIEVVHRNDVSPTKLEYLKRIDLFGVYRVDADWILSRCTRPQQIVCERIL